MSNFGGGLHASCIYEAFDIILYRLPFCAVDMFELLTQMRVRWAHAMAPWSRLLCVGGQLLPGAALVRCGGNARWSSPASVGWRRIAIDAPRTTVVGFHGAFLAFEQTNYCTEEYVLSFSFYHLGWLLDGPGLCSLAAVLLCACAHLRSPSP